MTLEKVELSFMTQKTNNYLKQKLENFERSVDALETSVAKPVEEPRDLSGIIKDFEISFELCWKTLKIYLETAGHTTGTARDIFKKAFSLNLVDNEEDILKMIEDRNLTVHTYDSEFATAMVQRIRDIYLNIFREIAKRVKKP